MKEEEKTDPDPKKRIMEAAIRLFAGKGYAATGMRELARAADVNLAMINYYYGSKQKILEMIIDEFFSRHIAIIAGNLTADIGPREKLERTIAADLAFFHENPDLVLVALTEFPCDLPEIAEYKADYVRRLMALMVENALPLLEETTGMRLRPEIFGPALVGMLTSHFVFKPVVEKIVGGFDKDFYDDYRKTITRLLMYGLFGKGPDKPDPADDSEGAVNA